MKFLHIEKLEQIINFFLIIIFILILIIGQAGIGEVIQADDIIVDEIIEDIVEDEAEDDTDTVENENGNENEIEKEYDIAVVDFEVTSPDPIVVELGRPLSERVITELHQISGINIVERSRLEEALEEHGLQQEGVIAEEEATEVGELVGADYLVTGSLVEITDQFILDYRLIDVKTGELKVAESVRGQGEEELMLDMVEDSAMTIGRQLVNETAREAPAEVSETQEDEDKYNLQVQIIGEGEVKIDPEREQYLEGEEIILSAQSSEGWEFEDWSEDIERSTREVLLIIEEDMEVTAQFQRSEVTKDFTYRLKHSIDAHEDWLRAVDISSNGTKIATASRDNTVKIWSSESGRLITEFEGHGLLSPVQSVQFTPDDKLVVSASTDETVKVWEAETGNLVNVFEEHDDPVYSLAVSSDNNLIVSGSGDGTARVWELKTGDIVETFSDHQGEVRAVDFSSEGELIVSGSGDETAIVWETESGEIVSEFDKFERPVTSVQFSPDNSKVVSGSFDNTVKVWEVETGDIITSFTEHGDTVGAVSFFEDWNIVASAGAGWDDNDIILWRVDTGEILAVFGDHDKPVWGIDVAKQDGLIASVSAGEILKIWERE